MTLTLTDIADHPAWQSETGDAAPSNPEAWLAWPARLTDEWGTEHTLGLPHVEGDPAPTRQDVVEYLATLPEGHDLHDARLTHPISGVRYVELFTPSEYGQMRRSDDDTVQWLLLLTQKADTIDLTRSRVTEGVAYLESVGILAEGRPAEILSNTAPDEA